MNIQISKTGWLLRSEKTHQDGCWLLDTLMGLGKNSEIQIILLLKVLASIIVYEKKYKSFMNPTILDTLAISLG